VPLLDLFITEFIIDDLDRPPPEGTVASVSLPPVLFSNLSTDSIGIFFTLYTEATLLPVREAVSADNASSLRTGVGSPIVAATVGAGLDFQDLNPPVLVNLTLNDFNGSVSERDGNDYSSDDQI